MVKCKECGYFAIRRALDGEVCAVERSQRYLGAEPKTGPHGQNRYDRTPFCYLGVFDLASETRERNSSLVKVADKERSCESWSEWTEGLSPKAHFDMNLLREQRDWQREESRKADEWRRTESQDAERRHLTHLIVFGVLVTVAMIVGQIVSAMISRSLLLP